MELSKINKAIELLKNNNIEELKELLEFERQASILNGKGKDVKFATLVKNLIKVNAESRPLLATIMHDKQDRQFICDGYMLARFEQHKEELDGLPQTPYGADKLNPDRIIIPKHLCEEYTLTDDEQLLLKNLDKYIAIHKTPNARNEIIPIYIFDRLFNAKLLANFIKITGKFDKVYLPKEHYSPIGVFEQHITAIALPIRVNGNFKDEKTEQMTADFIKKLREKN